MARNNHAYDKRLAALTPAHLLSIPEFCRENSISRGLAYRLLRDGGLKGVKVGKLTRIRRRDAETWRAKLQSYNSAA
jgi:excisionase family DNA binding protein